MEHCKRQSSARCGLTWHEQTQPVSRLSESLPNKSRKSSQYGPMHESKSAPALLQTYINA